MDDEKFNSIKNSKTFLVFSFINREFAKPLQKDFGH